jgi:hypothetical protein
MKRNISVLICSILFAMMLSSCIKEEVKSYQGKSVIEFDATVLNSATTPYTYHVAVRTPPFGIPTTTSNSVAITRTLTTPVRLRVNLVGPQRSVDEVITFRVLTDVTPASPNLLGVAGTHYNIAGTTFTIPANSSFGEVVINIVNPGTSSTSPREVHLELVGNENIKPSENYKRVAIRIAQN